MFPSVPRLYNKIYGSLKAASAATGKTNFAALIGGKVRYCVTGSAPIDASVLDFLKVAFDCPTIEGYGLTEVSGGVSFTNKNDPLTGHIGGPTRSQKFRLADVPEMNYLSTDAPYPRGELCIKGETVFCGYFKREDKTKEAFDADGWFRTGDVAIMYPNGSFKIIDRVKNIFKLSQGEYIAPEKIEGVFVLCPYVAQSLVYGDSFKSCAVAVIVPNEEKVKQWATKTGRDASEAYTDPGFIAEVEEALKEISATNGLSGLERPKAITLVREPFTIENNILTPTFKLKRNVAKEIFKDTIDKMYEKLAALESK